MMTGYCMNTIALMAVTAAAMGDAQAPTKPNRMVWDSEQVPQGQLQAGWKVKITNLKADAVTSFDGFSVSKKEVNQQ